MSKFEQTLLLPAILLVKLIILVSQKLKGEKPHDIDWG